MSNFRKWAAGLTMAAGLATQARADINPGAKVPAPHMLSPTMHADAHSVAFTFGAEGSITCARDNTGADDEPSAANAVTLYFAAGTSQGDYDITEVIQTQRSSGFYGGYQIREPKQGGTVMVMRHVGANMAEDQLMAPAEGAAIITSVQDLRTICTRLMLKFMP